MSPRRLSAQQRGPASPWQSGGCGQAPLPTPPPPKTTQIRASAPPTNRASHRRGPPHGREVQLAVLGGWAAPGHSPLALGHLLGSSPAAAQMSGTGNARPCQRSRPGWHRAMGTCWRRPSVAAPAQGDVQGARGTATGCWLPNWAGGEMLPNSGGCAAMGQGGKNPTDITGGMAATWENPVDMMMDKMDQRVGAPLL